MKLTPKQVEALLTAYETLERAAGELVELEPREFYGIHDDERCGFCGNDYVRINSDGELKCFHLDNCAWVAGRAALAEVRKIKEAK